MESETQQQKPCSIAKAYYRLFYFFFRIEKKRHPDVWATFFALLPMILFGYIDLMVLECLFSRFVYDLDIPKSVLYPIVLVLISVVFNVAVFCRNKRYLTIQDMFSSEDDDTRFKRSLLCVLYSLVTLFGSVILIEVTRLP